MQWNDSESELRAAPRESRKKPEAPAIATPDPRPTADASDVSGSEEEGDERTGSALTPAAANRVDNERETFVDVREVVNRALDTLSDSRERLQRLTPPDLRTRLFIDRLASQRQKLEHDFARTRSTAPAQVLDAFVQYGAGSNVPVPPTAGCVTPDDVTEWQLAVDDRLKATLLAVSERIQGDHPREFVWELVKLLESDDRRLSLLLHDSHDV